MPDRRLSGVVTLSVALLAGLFSMAPAALAADGEPVYHLPTLEGTALQVSAGNGASSFRSTNERFAFDFVAPPGAGERFTVAAARGGTVVGQRSGVPGGRCREPAQGQRPRCWRNVNYVLIDHGDGTSGLYLHLRRGDPIVRIGQVVSAGQPIGTAGASGWTDEVGMQFQLQRTPAWNQRGGGGWFLTRSQPVAFADPSVVELRPDGVPLEGDVVTSANPTPLREPFRFGRRSIDLPALVPLELGAERVISRAYDADSVDGYGLHVAPALDRADVFGPDAAEPDASSPAPDASPGPGLSPTPAPTDPGTAVRPLFGGELAYAGCATGASASLGRVVVIRRLIDDEVYLAVLGHLSEIEPTLLAQDPLGPLEIGPNELLGYYGVILPPGEVPELDCPEADPDADELFVGILRDASISPEGEISGGIPVSPEPLRGRGTYEGFAWWPGPLVAVAAGEEPGRPRANWHRRASAHSSHVPFGQPVQLVARVRDAADIAEVRFRAYYPRWPQPAGSRDLTGFDPTTTWRQVAVCRPPGASGVPRRTADCEWDGEADDAIVTFAWDPTAEEAQPAAAWLPVARTAMSRDVEGCVPVSLAVEVVDTAGHVFSPIGRLPLPARCDQRTIDASDNGRVVYLDPLVPPRAPRIRSQVQPDRAFPRNEPVFGPDPFDGRVVWRDRADNEDGYRVYVRRNWLRPDCTTRFGPFVLVDTLPANTTRYRPRHQRNLRLAPAPVIADVPGFMTRYEVWISAFNEAGQSERVFAGGFLAGGEAVCDAGLEPPPDDL